LNKVSLSVVEGAAFMVSFDDDDFNFDPVCQSFLLLSPFVCLILTF
jgi:hypothetical protein